MASLRKSFQGVWNVLCFNWHFYFLACMTIFLLAFAGSYSPEQWSDMFFVLSSLLALPIIISLVVTYWVYDCSAAYRLSWLKGLRLPEKGKVANIHAGFDETSELIKAHLSLSELKVLDFYDPLKHTEVSIRRARKKYPPYPGTIRVNSTELPIADEVVDIVFILFSAHEIRKEQERIQFFSELKRIITVKGQIVMLEHERNWENFLAYNIGVFHFYSACCWQNCFRKAGLVIAKRDSITPFLTTYTLEKDGNAP